MRRLRLLVTWCLLGFLAVTPPAPAADPGGRGFEVWHVVTFPEGWESRYSAARLAAAGAGAAFGRGGPSSFLDSDDYRDGEEVVGVLLTDGEYARMIVGIEYRGIEFDWSWYHADYAKPRRPTRLLFRAADYGTVRVPRVANHSAALAPGIEDEVRALFVQAMERLGLRVVADGEQAALELGVAIVDYKADSTYIFFANVDPFIELEIRLLDTSTGEPLLLIRNQDHNRTPALGAGDTAAGVSASWSTRWCDQRRCCRLTAGWSISAPRASRG